MLSSTDGDTQVDDPLHRLHEFLNTKLKGTFSTPDVSIAFQEAGVELPDQRAILAAIMGATASSIQVQQQRRSSPRTSEETFEPRVIAQKDDYSLLLIPLTIGMSNQIRPIMIGVSDDDAAILLQKNTFTVADFSENAIVQDFKQLSEVTDDAIASATEQFKSHFLTNKKMSRIKV